MAFRVKEWRGMVGKHVSTARCDNRFRRVEDTRQEGLLTVEKTLMDMYSVDAELSSRGSDCKEVMRTCLSKMIS